MKADHIYKNESKKYSNINTQIDLIHGFPGLQSNIWLKEDKKHQNPHQANYESINSLLIDSDANLLQTLEKRIHQYFPNVLVSGKFKQLEISKINTDLLKPDLVFLGLDNISDNSLDILDQFGDANFETIFITNYNFLNTTALRYNIAGCIHNPIQDSNLQKVVLRAQHKIHLQKEYLKSKDLLKTIRCNKSQHSIIGIPSIDGYNFIAIEQISHCKGMQKCTKIVTTSKTTMISSYNIGEFRKMLLPFGFFSPHKSYLINLSKLVKYNKEGTLTMKGNHHIPLARRRKDDFLDMIKRGLSLPIISVK